MDLNQIIKEVSQIAKQAGAEILKIYADESSFSVEYKKDDSPLTRADKAANDKICSGLEQLTPDWPIISEENKQVDYKIRSQYDYYWLVDPLDGTKEFIKRNGEFTVNIALIHDQRPIAGVVFVPVTDELYWAIKDDGAYQELGGKIKRLQCPSFSKSESGLGIVCSRSHLNDATQAFIDQFENPKLVATGSSLKFTIIAKGEAHIYPRLAPTMEWDTAAAQIVLEEAGGKVIQVENNEPLEYNKENLLNPQFVALGNEDVV
jgi:3'(2'), 5'-bisphosphate nucleotidase